MWRLQDILGRGATACVHKALCIELPWIAIEHSSIEGRLRCDWSMAWALSSKSDSPGQALEGQWDPGFERNQHAGSLRPKVGATWCNRHLEKWGKSRVIFRRRLSRAAKDEIDRELRPARSSKQFIVVHSSSQTSERFRELIYNYKFLLHFLSVLCTFKRPHVSNKHSPSWLIILLWAQHRMPNIAKSYTLRPTPQPLDA